MLFGLSGVHRGPQKSKLPTEGKYGDKDYTNFVSQEPVAAPPQPSKKHVSKSPGTFSKERRQLGQNRSEGKKDPYASAYSLKSTSVEDNSCTSLDESDMETVFQTPQASKDATPISVAQKRSESTSKVYEYLEAKAEILKSERALDLGPGKLPEPIPPHSQSPQRSPRKNRFSQKKTHGENATPELVTLQNHQAALKSIKDDCDKQLMQERAKVNRLIERDDMLKIEQQLAVTRMKQEHDMQLFKQQEHMHEVHQTLAKAQSENAAHRNEVEGYKSLIENQQGEIEQLKSLLKLHAAERHAEVSSLKAQLKQYGSAFADLTEEFDRGLESIAAGDIGTSMIMNAQALAEVETLKTELAHAEAVAEAKYAYFEQLKAALQKQVDELNKERNQMQAAFDQLQSDKEKADKKAVDYEDERTFFKKQLNASTDALELEREVRKRAEAEKQHTEEQWKQKHRQIEEEKQQTEEQWKQKHRQIEEEKQRTEEEWKQRHRQIEEDKKRTEDEYKRKWDADREDIQEKNRWIEEERKRAEEEKHVMLKKNEEEKQRLAEEYQRKIAEEREEKQRQIEDRHRQINQLEEERREKQRQIDEERKRRESLQSRFDQDKSNMEKEKLSLLEEEKRRGLSQLQEEKNKIEEERRRLQEHLQEEKVKTEEEKRRRESLHKWEKLSLSNKWEAEKSKLQTERQQRENEKRELSLPIGYEQKQSEDAAPLSLTPVSQMTPMGAPPLALGPLSLEEQKRKMLEEKTRLMKVERQRQAELQRQRQIEANKTKQIEEIASEQDHVFCYSPSADSTESALLKNAATDTSADLVDTAISNIEEETQRRVEEIEALQRQHMEEVLSVGSLSHVECYSRSSVDSEHMYTAIEASLGLALDTVQAIDIEEKQLQAEREAEKERERKREEIKRRQSLEKQELEELLAREAKEQEEKEARERQRRQEQREREAAIKIQSLHRGNASRKEVAALREKLKKEEEARRAVEDAKRAAEEAALQAEQAKRYAELDQKEREELQALERKFKEEDAARKKKEEEEERLRQKAIKEAKEARKKKLEEEERMMELMEEALREEEEAKKKMEEEARKKKEEEDAQVRQILDIGKQVIDGYQQRIDRHLEDSKKKDEEMKKHITDRELDLAKTIDDHQVQLKKKEEEMKKHINDRELVLSKTQLEHQMQLQKKDAEWAQRLNDRIFELEDERRKRDEEWKKIVSDQEAQWAKRLSEREVQLQMKDSQLEKKDDQWSQLVHQQEVRILGTSAEWIEKLESTEDQWAELVSTQEERFVQASADFAQQLANNDVEWAKKLAELEAYKKEHEVVAKKKEHEWSKRLNDLKEERTVLQKRLTQLAQNIKHEMGHERILKEHTAMQIEDQRSHLAILLEENRYQYEELQTLRSMAMVSSTQTTEVWRMANQAMEAQRTKMEKEARDELEATRQAHEDKVDGTYFRKQLELQRHIYDLEEEATEHKKLIKSLLEEHADTLDRERISKERMMMKAEDYLSKAWENSVYKEGSFANEEQLATGILGGLYTKLAAESELAQRKQMEAQKAEIREVLTQMNMVVAGKKERIDALEHELMNLRGELAMKDEEIQNLKVFSLQPVTAHGRPAEDSGKTAAEEGKDLKKTMRDFLQEMLKGKQMKLVTEGGGVSQCTLSILKDLSALSLTASHKTYSIPMQEIQHIISGKDVPPNVWTSTPVDDTSITVLFGKSVTESHTCCFRMDSIEERDKFVSSMKVLRLSNVKR